MVNTEAFKRYVEVGRVVLLNGGESEGKLAVIAEIIDQNRVSIGMSTVKRHYHEHDGLCRKNGPNRADSEEG